MTILAVDDSAGKLNELIQLLKRAFPEAAVIGKSDALAAGKFCFNNPVDALFAAVEMPRLDGLRLMEFARHANSDVMMFLLVDADGDSGAGLLKDEVDGLLYDPITEEDLCMALQSARHKRLA